MTRLPRPNREDWDEGTKSIFEGRVEPCDQVADPSGEQAHGPPNILWTIAHHSPLLQPFLAFAATLALRGVLTRRDSEVLALRTAWNCNSAFEWGHHVLYGLAEGLRDEEIAGIATGPSAGCWGERDVLLLTATDQLTATHTIDEATWGALAQAYEPAQLVELTFVVGNYTMLSMVANATGVPLEPGLPAMPS
ncbi:MAG: 4-carboxymuconolactone decarboxylase [Myxococcota bacterium]|jgi:4-carboxymuconolactone decarboxylase